MRPHVLLLVAPAVLVACGGKAPGIAAPRTSAATIAKPSGQPAAKPKPTAAKPTAATCDGIRECATVGLALVHEGGDRDEAKLALGKACTGVVRSIDACAVLAGMMDDADPALLADVAHNGCNGFGAENGESEARGAACAVWGTARRDGKGVEANASSALLAFEEGCRLQNPRACDGARDLREAAKRRADAESGVPGANLEMASLTTNGVTVENVACRADGDFGAVFGSVAIGKPFADKKSTLDACVKSSPRRARVRWTAGSAGRMSEVKVISGDDPANRCIERALTGAKTAVIGTCAASLDLGPGAGGDPSMTK